MSGGSGGAARLGEVRGRLAAAAARAGRRSEDVVLVAVSKGRPVEQIRELYEAGHRDFGENRAQELVGKIPELPGDIRWHFVGPLQTNKVRLVRPAVVMLHSLDRPSLASAWVKGPGRPPPALVEINVGREPQKAGPPPEGAAELLESAVGVGIEVAGLMAIPPQLDEPEAVRPYFRRLAELRTELEPSYPGLVELSMGMTDDFEVAVEEGATIIRIGRALFAH